jgi:hypothetical protein
LALAYTDAHGPSQALVVAPQLLQGYADSLDVDDLTVADSAERKLGADGALEAQAAIDGDLGGGDATRLDIEPDNRTSAGRSAKCKSHRHRHRSRSGSS